MKRMLLRLIAAVFMLLPVASQGTEGSPAIGVVDQYTHALVSGDVEVLKTVLGGRLYAKRRALLEDNHEYPDWLRQYYAGADFSASLSGTGSDRYPAAAVVELMTTLANGEIATTRLVVLPDATGTVWKIVDQLR